jgi:hypothetical protein
MSGFLARRYNVCASTQMPKSAVVVPQDMGLGAGSDTGGGDWLR